MINNSIDYSSLSTPYLRNELKQQSEYVKSISKEIDYLIRNLDFSERYASTKKRFDHAATSLEKITAELNQRGTSNIGKWMVNFDKNEIWQTSGHYDTKQEAIDAGLAEIQKEDQSFDVGQVAPANIHYGIDADVVLDQIAEHAYEEVGEVADDYLNHVPKEERDVLTQDLFITISKWFKKYNYNQEFYKITNIERINEKA